MSLFTIEHCAIELGNLSGRFGPLEYRLDGTLYTTDDGYKDVLEQLKYSPSKSGPCIGIFVGSGGLLSLLPDLPIDIALSLDMNTAVLDFNQLLIQLVKEARNPRDVLSLMTTKESVEKIPLLKQIADLHEDADFIVSYIREEGRQFGEQHWTNPKHFEKVKGALEKKPVIDIAANLLNPDFTGALVIAASHFNASITFANFTNVHEWLAPNKMTFLRDWPFNAQSRIMFSRKAENLGEGLWPRINVVPSLEDYLAIPRTAE